MVRRATTRPRAPRKDEMNQRKGDLRVGTTLVLLAFACSGGEFQADPGATGGPSGGDPSPRGAGGTPGTPSAAGGQGSPGGTLAAPGNSGGPPGASGAPAAPGGSGASGSPSEPACTWYWRDLDGDGWGAGEARQWCEGEEALGSGWVEQSGDCADDNLEVHPGQFGKFGVPYEDANGLMSFDYNCDGAEQYVDQVPPKTMECKLEGVTCVGGGVLPDDTRRLPDGGDRYCGGRLHACDRHGDGVLVPLNCQLRGVDWMAKCR
jgi:hypothetical protein